MIRNSMDSLPSEFPGLGTRELWRAVPGAWIARATRVIRVGRLAPL